MMAAVFDDSRYTIRQSDNKSDSRQIPVGRFLGIVSRVEGWSRYAAERVSQPIGTVMM